MLTNYKNYMFLFAIIGTFFYAGLIKIKNIKLESKLETCNANYIALQAKIKIADEMRARQEKTLRLKEQETAKALAESQKRKDLIMQTEIKGGCEGANKFMLDQAMQLKFTWNNNIP